jgi:DNA helicase HerA-like ATPase
VDVTVTDLGRRLRSAVASRILELPRRPVAPDQVTVADLGRRQRLAAVVSAYHAAGAHPADGAALLLGWSRPGAGTPVEVFTAGGLAGVVDAAGVVRLALPQGCTGVRYPAGELFGRLRAVPCWTAITAVSDGLLLDDESARPDEARPSLDECLLQVWQTAFAWFVLAEPVPSGELAEAAAGVAAQERMAQGRASSPEQAVLAARLQRRHRELRQGESTGMWRLHLFAGGATPAGAASVAGLLCASADLHGLPYALARSEVAGDLDGVLAAASEAGSAPLVSSLMIASLAVPPIDEVPGVRMTLRPDFDVTPETGAAGHGFPLGAVLDRGGVRVGEFRVPAASLNRHTFVCGATGTGKSQTIRALLEAAAGQRLPWLVVEPAKAEYRRMADRIGGDRVVAIRPGDPAAPPAGFNPLRPADSFPLQTHLDLVRSLYLAAFRAEEPFPQVLSAALTRCYEDLGWDLVLGEPRVPGTSPRWPTLGDLQQAAEAVVDEIGYGKEITGNVRGFIRVRLASLRLGTTGRFFEGGHPLDFGALLQHNVVFEIEDVGDDRDKAFLIGALLIQLVEHLRVRARHKPAAFGEELRHLSVFEEAHRLLRRGEDLGPAARAVEMFASMLAEIRAYGEGLVIAEQIPSKLVPDVIKNTAVKVMHRLPALDDREAVGATINLTDRQSRYLVTLPPGTGAVFADGMDLPVLIQMPDGTDRERGGQTPTAPVDALIGRRSATCGADCRTTPCTLREMRSAQHLLHDQPWIVLWAELGVLGHLTGWPTPVIRAAHIRTLLARRGRLLDCAISHAVEDAVAVRSSLLSCDPASLAGHILQTLRGHLAGQNLCARDEPAYLTQAASRAVSFGTRTPSAIERCVGSTSGAHDWPARLEKALGEHFAGSAWPPRYLIEGRAD